jgi:hypothetical protein
MPILLLRISLIPKIRKLNGFFIPPSVLNYVFLKLLRESTRFKSIKLERTKKCKKICFTCKDCKGGLVGLQDKSWPKNNLEKIFQPGLASGKKITSFV